eukprot:COSAG02_NODE_4091_length_5797_cov_127.687434_5_plen_97_part_00
MPGVSMAENTQYDTLYNLWQHGAPRTTTMRVASTCRGHQKALPLGNHRHATGGVVLEIHCPFAAVSALSATNQRDSVLKRSPFRGAPRHARACSKR